MKKVIRISSILFILLIISFSFSGVFARDPGAAIAYSTNDPVFADPGEDPHLDIRIQSGSDLPNYTGSNSFDNTDNTSDSIKNEKINGVSRGPVLSHKFKFVFYSIFGIYFQ